MTKAERDEWKRRGFQDPVVAYRQQAVNAGRRGVPFELTFDEWWGIWAARYEERGPRRDQLVMCRNRDLGRYEAGNVRLDTPTANAQEAKRMRQFARQGDSDPGWLHNQFRRSMGYFQLRMLMERRAELGLDDDED